MPREPPGTTHRLTNALAAFLAGLGLPGGWLVVFDQRAKQPPIAERTRVDMKVTTSGRSVAVIHA